MKITDHPNKCIAPVTNHLSKLAEVDNVKKHDVIVREAKPRCTENQRKYYWAVIVKYFQDEIGEYVPMCIHSALKEQILIPMFQVSSTEDLSTAEREDYHQACRGLFREQFGGEIPLPNETDF